MVARREKRPARERPYAPDPPGMVLEKGLPPDHPQRCYAHKHNGRRCGRIAVNGSKTCAIHGGRPRSPGDGNLYARYTKGKLKEAIKRFEAMPDIKNLRPELTIARALLSRYLAVVKKSSNPVKFQSALSRSIEVIGGLSEKISKMEDGLKIHLDLKQAEMLVHAVMNAVNDAVDDEAIRQKIADKLSNIKLLKRGA